MIIRNFRKLEIWNDAIEVVTIVYKLIKKLPNTEKFGLYSQLSRAVISIPSNIAEGCAKDSQKEFIRFLKISLGSSFEVETQIIICIELGYFTKDEGESIIEKINILQKRINALTKYARTQISKA
ncbi:four helix bundle protein [uncultured Kordia sp.]|uniref:four helix bundle protein n=1 Tax=uncultured Kordia sp. TaxID=507699 RepID=UPI00345BFD79